LIGKNITNSVYVTGATAKSILKKRDEEEGEKQHAHNATLEYLTKFSKVSKQKADEIVKVLIEKAGLDEQSAVRLIDYMPEDKEDVKIVLGKKRMGDDEVKKILDIITKG
jgi:DNA-directed RNA polymerase subunit F